MFYWVSIDPANRSGVAFWVRHDAGDNSGDRLLKTGIVRAMGNKGNYVVEAGGGGDKYESKLRTWNNVLLGQSAVAIEEGAGRFVSAVKAQALLRGYIRAVWDFTVLVRNDTTVLGNFHTINVSEWRRVIKEHYGVSWPKDSERCKALSVKLVNEHFGVNVSDDEADAVLIGVAARRMRLIG